MKICLVTKIGEGEKLMEIKCGSWNDLQEDRVKRPRYLERKGEDRNVEGESYLTECVTKDKSKKWKKKKAGQREVCVRGVEWKAIFPEYDRRGGRVCVFDEVMEQKKGGNPKPQHFQYGALNFKL